MPDQSERAAATGTNDELTAALAQLRAEREQRERLEEQLRQVYHLHTLGILSGGVIHDLCNLLLVVQSSGELLLRELSQPELRHELQTMLLATQESAKLTRQVLSWGHAGLHSQAHCCAGEVITALEPLLRRLLPQGIELRLQLTDADDTLALTPAALCQLVLNLVMNARDAMPLGGLLTIETQTLMLDEGGAQALELEPGPYLALRVEDSGVGMDETTMSRLFEPLFSTKGARGTGLGLSTVRWIVQGAQGQLQVTSALGEGSSFTIYLPTWTDSEEASNGEEIR